MTAATPPEQQPSELRMDRMEANIDRLQEDMVEVKQDLETVKQDLDVVKQDVVVLKQDMSYVKGDVATLKGWGTELASRSHPEYYVRAIGLVRPRLVSKEEILTLAADAWEAGLITEAELDQMGSADTYLKARRKSDRQEVWIVSQVSFSIYPNDVTRATDEAAILGKITGETVIPAVAGERITTDAGESAQSSDVPFVHIRNGSRMTE